MATSEANGITIGESVTQSTTEARRLASDLPRGCEAIREIQPGHLYDTTVWIRDTAADGGESFDIPEGWSVAETFVASSGAVALNINRDGEVTA